MAEDIVVPWIKVVSRDGLVDDFGIFGISKVNGYLARFKERNKIVFEKIHGDANSVDEFVVDL